MSIADFNGDGRLDIFLPQVGMDQLYMAQSDGTMADESSERLPAGLDSASTAGIAFDADGDGDEDLLITRRVGGLSLLINDGDGNFSDGTDAAGLSETGHPAASATIADIDGDGDLDIFVITYRHCDMMGWDPDNPFTDTPQALWENQGDGSFADITASMPEHPGENARLRAAAWFDADQDGTLDLYTVSDKGITSACQVDNQLFYSDGAGYTEDASSAYLDLTMEGMGIALGDLNGDEYPELAMSDMSRAWLMESDGIGGWYDASAARELILESMLDDRWSGWGTVLEDFDNDGRLDLFMGFGGLPDVPESTMNPTAQPDGLWLQAESGQFEQVADDWGVAGETSTRAVIATDLNGDGWLDLATREIGGQARVWLAKCGAERWVRVALEQSDGNPQAIGAIVTVTAGDDTHTRWLTLGADGLQSSAPVDAHFGLGDASTVDIRVTWPDGLQTEFADVSTNQALRIVR